MKTRFTDSTRIASLAFYLLLSCLALRAASVFPLQIPAIPPAFAFPTKIVCVGDNIINLNEQIPADLTNIVQVAAGHFHVAALRADGTVVCFGTTDNVDITPLQPLGLSNVVAIASGKGHVLALKSDGTVVRWGKGSSGVDGTHVPPGLSNVVAIAGGFDQSIALRADGKVFLWYTADQAQWGQVPGVTNIVKITADNSGGIGLSDENKLVEFFTDGVHATHTLDVGFSRGLLKKVSAQLAGMQMPITTFGNNGNSLGLLRVDGTLAFDPPDEAAWPGLINGDLIYHESGVLGQDGMILAQNISPVTLTGVVDIDVGERALVARKSDGRLVCVWRSPNGGEWVFPAGISNNVVDVSLYERSTAVLIGDPVIFQPPQIVQQPADVTAVAGAGCTMTVVATGTPPLSYQWRKNGLPLAGQNYATLNLANLTVPDSGSYDVLVKGSGTPAVSAQAKLTVMGPPLITGSEVVLGTAGVSLSHQIMTYGQAHGFFASGLPAGVSIHPETGLVSGIPSYGGSYPATIVATNEFGAGSKTIIFQIRHKGTVVAWGINTYGQTNVPAGLSNVIAVAGGGFSSLALLTDGTVRQWGDYAQPPLGLTNVTAISAGFLHYLALKSDGSAVGWAADTNNAPFGEALIPSSATNLIAVAAGDQHSLALRADGIVVGWGRNDFGQCSIPAGLTNVVGISARGYSSFAVRSDGSLVQWGAATNSAIPGNLTNAIGVSAGLDHTLALLADRTLAGWGDSNKLGFPVGLTNVLQMSAGIFHSVALASYGPVPGNNMVIVWGQTNGNDGSQFILPAELFSPAIRVTDVAAGHLHSVALLGEVEPPAMPLVIKQPENQLGHLGGTVSFFATAFGSGPLQYQWSGLGQPLPGATNATLILANLQLNQSGAYFVVISNQFGAVTSSIANLAVSGPGNLPAITVQPENQTVGLGSMARFSVATIGAATLHYQWLHNGTPLPTATSPSLSFMATNRANAGGYAVVITNVAGSVTSSPALLRVRVPQRLLPPLRLGNGQLRFWFNDGDGGSLGVNDLPFFEVQVSTTPTHENWTILAGGLVLTNGMVQFDDTEAANHSRRFYRVLER